MRTGFALLVALVLVLPTSVRVASVPQDTDEETLSGNTPGFIKHAKDLGPVDPSLEIAVTVWLKLRQEQQLDRLLAQQYTKGHAKFHKWLTQEEFDAQFSPTAPEVNAVQNWLSAHDLSVLTVAENNFFVTAVGTVDAVEKAFHVQIDNFELDGEIFRANTGDPRVKGLGNVAAITGLADLGYEPLHVRPTDVDGTPLPFVDLSDIEPAGAFFETACFRGVETRTFTSGNVTATYSGNRFGADITNRTPGHLPACGYSPRDIHAAYNMNPLYAAGLDGAGETIVIVVGYGSATIERDAAAFSAFYGLPPVDLSIMKAPGLVHVPSGGWRFETTLDVEWAHAMAPRARIALVVAPATAALEEAINYAVVHDLGNTISNSWGRVEGLGTPAQLRRQERILQMAAAKGIDVNFASGDCADEVGCRGFKTVDYPASSPFATGVGGTSLALNADREVIFETGWGSNLTWIADGTAQGNRPLNPPLTLGFGGIGSGGGDSLTFAKPDFQSGLPGTTRQVPDVGMVADPRTGVEYIITDPATGRLVVGLIGGTSLSSPLFSGLMAIAAQKNGHVGLGQAARLVYALPDGAINDVGAPLSFTNVTGTITTSSGSTTYSADALATPETTIPYYSALYNIANGRWFVLTFNTNKSKAATAGYDHVTGVGAPNGFNFVHAIVP